MNQNKVLMDFVSKVQDIIKNINVDDVKGGRIQKEYYKAGIRTAITAVNLALAQMQAEADKE